jgi:adenylate cyclase
MVWKRLGAGLVIGLCTAVAVLAILSGSLPLPATGRDAVRHAVRRGELQANDLLLHAFGQDRPAGDDVVLAIANQADLDAIADATGEGWPWPREYWAVLTRFLTDAGASVIGFDLFFSEPSRYPEDDRALGTAIADSGRVVLAVGTSAVATDGHAQPAPQPVPFAGDRDALRRRARLVPPIPDIGHPGTALGIGDVRGDDDELIRRLAPALLIAGEPVATFATRIAMLHRGIDRLGVEDGQLVLGDRRLPLARDGSFTLRFRRPDPPRTPADISFPSVHVADLLHVAFEHADGHPVPPEWIDRLRGKVVIVGVNAPGVEDVEVTPVSGTYLAPELHATGVDNLLRGDVLDEWPRPGPWEHVPAAVLSLLVALVAILPQSASVAALASTGAFALYAGTTALAYRHGVLMPLFGPLAGTIAAFGSSMLWLYFTEGRQRRQIGRMFAQYVSPAVVQELQRHPEKLKLGGERREMTAFFSDIEGFTTVSEAMQPEELVAFLNDYLTRCTDLILDTGGVIDKFEGDAIIAFWNAPLDLADHPSRACDAALRCQAACAAFREECAARGLPPIRMRVGLNTGPMVVGNMGSQKRFDFTIMGDAVNLAARLEGANKVFGTYLMVSEATRQACDGGFAFRELGRLRVKGKTVPITVYELLARGPVPPWVARFEAALAEFYAGRFDAAQRAFQVVLAERPDDPPSVRYLARLQEICQGPHPPNFDGVLTLTEK